MVVSRFLALLAILRSLDTLFRSVVRVRSPELVLGQITLLYSVSQSLCWIYFVHYICKYGGVSFFCCPCCFKVSWCYFPFRGARLMPELVFGRLTLLYSVSQALSWICFGYYICKYGGVSFFGSPCRFKVSWWSFPFRGARLMPELVFGQLTLLYSVSQALSWICFGHYICKYGGVSFFGSPCHFKVSWWSFPFRQPWIRHFCFTTIGLYQLAMVLNKVLMSCYLHSNGYQWTWTLNRCLVFSIHKNYSNDCFLCPKGDLSRHLPIRWIVPWRQVLQVFILSKVTLYISSLHERVLCSTSNRF